MAKSRNSKNATVPLPPDGGYGWVVLVACFMVSFIVDGCMYSIGLILKDIREDYGVSQEIVNLLPSLNTGFLFCSGPIVSGLSNQLGVRVVVMGGAIVTSICYVACAFAPSIYFMMILYGVIGGISTGCTYIASLIIIAEYFDKKKGIATGICMAGSGVGAFAFAPFIEWLLTVMNWKSVMILLGGILLQCCLMGAFLRPAPRTTIKKLLPNSENKEAAKNVQTFSGSMASIATNKTDEDSSCCKNFLSVTLQILKEMVDIRLLTQNMGFLFITLSGFFVFAGYFIPFIYIPLRITELQIENGSWVLSIIGIINIPARLTFGFLADSGKVTAVNLNTSCIIVAILAMTCYGFLNTFILQCIFSVVFAIGIAGMNCLMTPYLMEIVGPEKFSNSVGILNLFRGFGCFLGPVLAGVISDKLKIILAAFYYSTICLIIGGAFALLVSLGSVIKKCRNKDNKETEIDMS